MIRDLVLDAEPAKPAIGQIDLHFSADASLRADRKHIADDEHPDHEHRIDRRPPRVGVVGRQCVMHPAEIEHSVDPAHQILSWHYRVQVELVEELAPPFLSPTHHHRTPLTTASDRRNHGSVQFSMGVLQHIRVSGLSPGSRHESRFAPLLTKDRCDNACSSADISQHLSLRIGFRSRPSRPVKAVPTAPVKAAP
jgi:hypothetical protein